MLGIVQRKQISCYDTILRPPLPLKAFYTAIYRSRVTHLLYILLLPQNTTPYKNQLSSLNKKKKRNSQINCLYKRCVNVSKSF